MPCLFFLFFFNDTATTEIYTLSLHDALPISQSPILSATASLPAISQAQCLDEHQEGGWQLTPTGIVKEETGVWRDRKSTRLNSSHLVISYAVFCLKKKKKQPSIHYDHV